MKLAYLITIVLSLVVISSQLEMKISSKFDRCFIEDLYNKDHLVSYKISGADSVTEKDIPSLLQGLSFKLYTYTEKKELLHIESVKGLSGKFIIQVPKSDQYRLCISYYGGYWDGKLELSINVQVTSDMSLVPNLEGAVKHHHIEDMHYTLKESIRLLKDAMVGNESEVQMEDMDSDRIMKSVNFFYYITMFQIFVIVIFFGYQIYKIKSIFFEMEES